MIECYSDRNHQYILDLAPLGSSGRFFARHCAYAEPNGSYGRGATDVMLPGITVAESSLLHHPIRAREACIKSKRTLD